MLAILPIILIAVGSFATLRAQSSSQFENLKEPRITTRKDEKMLVVEATGDPNVIGPKAFGLLFQLYYTIKETPKGPGQGAPRARWPVSLETPKSEWTGLYALPIPDSVSELPQHNAPPGTKAAIATWEYGEIAEILHVGSYDKEEPTFERLKDFVKKHGYVTIGGHEEEYIKGPTMSGKGDPETYLTIIRYRVQKRAKTQ
jgi:hypothetical protein